MSSIRRIFVVSTLFACVVVTIVFVVFSLQEGRRIQTEPDPVASVQENLIRKIVNYESRARSTTNTRNTPVAKTVRQELTRESEPRIHIPRQDNYTVVSVVHDLAKETYSVDQTHTTGNISVESVDRAWLTSPDAVENIVKQAGDNDQTYVWLEISRPVDVSLMQLALRKFDASVLGSSGDLVRLLAPNDKENLISIRDIPWVSGIGALPPNEKISQFFQDEINNSVSSKQLPVFVTVMSSELESAFRRTLTDIGISVGHFDPSIRVFAAVLNPAQVPDLVQLDFVQRIEPISIVSVAHDTAVPAQGVDKLRTIGNLAGAVSGVNGTTTPIGVMDTGLNTNHFDISTFRESVCAKNFVENESLDLRYDEHGHGTHVTGTIVGNGFFVPKFTGMAPGVQHIRFAKVLSTYGFGSFQDINLGMDYLAEESSCIWEGQETESIRPLIVNMSLSGTSLTWDSRSTGARKLDSIVWTHRQLYVVANSNASLHGYSNYAAAKNSLPVGAALDGGEIAGFSSLGPTIDNRLTPLVTGTGVGVRSIAGSGSYDDYSTLSGTSMASPSVAGLAALLMDASPDHREQPALVRARLMASAVKPDAWFESESQFPRNNTNGPGETQAYHGMGMVSANATVLNNDSENGWISSGASVELEHGEYAYYDIQIPEGTSRVDVVMTWDEPATDAIANNVLNDLDLWIDHGADCGTEPCGEYSSRSEIDNVEWIIIQNPESGTYRLKIHANSVYTDAPRAAVAWTIIRGDSTPQLTVEANQNIYETPSGSNHSHRVNLTVSTESYIAKGVSLHIDCRTLDGKACGLGRFDHGDTFRDMEHSGLVQRSDGIDVAQAGEYFVLGEIPEGSSTNVALNLYAQDSQPMRVYVIATSWNGKSGVTSFLVRPTGSSDELAIATAPLNDDFDDALDLEGVSGSFEFDLLTSSKEVGEPLHEDAPWREARATGSVWFQITAARSGLASFVATPTNRDFLNRHPKVQLYQVTDACCSLSDARLLASANWSAQAFVKEGYDYRVRVSVAGESLPLTLNWFQGDRPINDSFAYAIELSGESGEISGDNLGATLEVGELYGSLSSSVWYQWTAPDDGQWEFRIPDNNVVRILAFAGDVVSDLRLVSDFDIGVNPITVYAKKDQTFRIMVASPDAYSGGWAYDALTWTKVEQDPRDNDMFEDARDLGNEEMGSRHISRSSYPTIEPDEPESTGVHSVWWRWQAPQDGRFTFFWTGSINQNIAAFTGSSIGDLQLATLDDDSTTENEFVIDAAEDEEYWLSVGLEKFAPDAFTLRWTVAQLSWGSTPSNNTAEHATMLVGDQGAVRDTNLFATTERDGWEHLGRSAMWYAHEVSETGWVKYWIESSDLEAFRLAAFKQMEENSDREFVMVSKRYLGQADHIVEVVVYVEEGMQVFLRIASELSHQGNSFTLRWEATDAPNWLAYVGRLSNGTRDGGGNISRLQNPGEISLNTDGSGLYVTSDNGLHAYRRDLESGELTLLAVYQDIPEDSHHIWDPHRSQLYVNHDVSWWTFAASLDDPPELDLVDSFEEQDGVLSLQNSVGPRLVLGDNGDYLYRLNILQGQQIYDFSVQGKPQYYGTDRDPPYRVYPSYDGHFWYSLNDGRSVVSKNVRIPGSPFRERISKSTILPSYIDWFVRNDHSNQFTFVAARFELHVFDNQLEADEFTKLVSEYNFANELNECAGIFVRKDRYVVELICGNGVIVLEFDPVENDVQVTDRIVARNPDRFGRSLPFRYYLSLSGDGVAASPDGRHIYASTINHGILIFERYGNTVVDMDDNANLSIRRLDLLRVADGLVQFDDDSVNDGCLESSSWTIGDATYTIESSKWQEREAGSKWTDVDGTIVSSQLCTHSPERNREYRIVASIEVDGTTNEYASNFFARLTYEQFDDLVVSSGEIELNGSRFNGCVYLSDTSIGDKTYTVFNAKWESRADTDSPWSYVKETETSGELCPLTVSDDLEYRLVGSIMVNNERGHRRSNKMQQDESDD